MCIPSRPAKPSQSIGGKSGTYISRTSALSKGGSNASIILLKGRVNKAPVTQAPAIAAPEKPDLGLTAAGNTIEKTMQLAGGIGTIESIQASARSAENLTLESPFGLYSQRVQRAKSRLSIAM